MRRTKLRAHAMDDFTTLTGALMAAIAAQTAAIGILWRRVEKGLEHAEQARKKCEAELESLLYRLVSVVMPDERRSALVKVPNPGRRKADAAARSP